MNRDDAYLLDMLKAASRASEAIQGNTYEEFRRDWRLQSIVLHQMMVLGEATKRLSDELRGRYRAIDWRAIAGHRDILIHRYDDAS